MVSTSGDNRGFWRWDTSYLIYVSPKLFQYLRQLVGFQRSPGLLRCNSRDILGDKVFNTPVFIGGKNTWYWHSGIVCKKLQGDSFREVDGTATLDYAVARLDDSSLQSLAVLNASADHKKRPFVP